MKKIPTVDITEVEVDGKAYKLVFDYDALAEAEEFFNSNGNNILILDALPNPFLMKNTRLLFAAAAHKYQPDLTLEDVRQLLTISNAVLIANALATAYVNSMSKTKGETANPQ